MNNQSLLKNIALACIVVFVLLFIFWSFNSGDATETDNDTNKKSNPPINLANSISIPEYHNSYAKLTHLLSYLFEDPPYKCKNVLPLPANNEADGTWRICAESLPSPPCVEYSFGIANDFRFEDAYRLLTKCDVYTFDPSMDKPDHVHADGVLFYNLGLSAVKNDNYPGRGYGANGQPQTWKMDTIKNIMERFNHTRGTILKIDTEGAEWDSLLKSMEDGTLLKWDQLLFEVHFWGFTAQNVDAVIEKWHNFFVKLHNLGYRLFNTHVNPYSPSIKFPNHYFVPCCFELSMINTHTH